MLLLNDIGEIAWNDAPSLILSSKEQTN